MKRIWSIILALCLLGSQAAYAAVGTQGAGGSSTVEIEVVKTLDQRVTLTVIVENESGTPLDGVTVQLIDPDNPTVPPITGADQQFMTDAQGRLELKLFPQNTQFFQIKINHLGYEPYASERFQVAADSERTVVLKQPAEPPATDYYTVYYYALEGGSVDRKSERVRWNQVPKQVPTPVPDEGWRFASWTLDGSPVAPETVKIRKTTRFYAEFEEVPAVIPPIPTETVTPSPHPVPTERPELETPEPTPAVPVGPGSTQNGGAGGTGGGGEDPQTPPNAGAETPPPDQPAASGPGTPPSVAPGPGTTTPDVPEEPVSPVVQGCHVHWVLLGLALGTLLCTALRLNAIRRRMRELEEYTEDEEVPVP